MTKREEKRRIASRSKLGKDIQLKRSRNHTDDFIDSCSIFSPCSRSAFCKESYSVRSLSIEKQSNH